MEQKKRKFSYFLFENFDPEEAAGNPSNPRVFLGEGTDGILSDAAEGRTGEWDLALIGKLIDGGVLRREGAGYAFDCPVFLREDAAALRTGIREKASALADVLETGMAEIRECCSGIQNGFTVEENLYHILCGMVFDGQFFDYLSDRGALATSRMNPSGLDYLTVIYEKCPELDELSGGLLCSYNRLVNEQCALQSFGDARGSRFDFYRFFRLRELGKLTGRFEEAEERFRGFGGGGRDALLAEAVALARTGKCDPGAMGMLELFGYARDGAIAVPVFGPEHREAIAGIEQIVEEALGVPMVRVLEELGISLDITSVRQGVDRLEIANELYHIVFGFLNEELVERGIVAAPPEPEGEGRYWKCIELYE